MVTVHGRVAKRNVELGLDHVGGRRARAHVFLRKSPRGRTVAGRRGRTTLDRGRLSSSSARHTRPGRTVEGVLMRKCVFPADRCAPSRSTRP
eukprot:209985-Prymnesium_polylepis.1